MKTLSTPDANGLLDLDLDPSEIAHVEVVIGAIDACSRHLDGIGPRLVIYPRTSDGRILGTGAHPGFVTECTPDVAERIGFTTDEIYASAGANQAYQHDDTGPCCGDCLSACGEYDPRKDADRPVGVCWSCSQMIAEGWQHAQERR